MINKNDILRESFHVYGKDNYLTILKNPKKRHLKDLLIKKGMLTSFEERVALKRALRSRKIDFNEESLTHDLVRLAMNNKINFNKITY